MMRAGIFPQVRQLNEMNPIHLVTGASGVLGQAVVGKLIQQKIRVRAYDRFPSQTFPEEVELVQGDIRDRKKLLKSLKGCQVVHHLAAKMPQWRIGKKGFKAINVAATKALIQSTVQAGVKRLVFASTIEIYGAQDKYPLKEEDKKKFTGEYSRTKWACEKKLLKASRKHNLEVVSLRMPMIFGKGFYHERSILLLFDLVSRNLPVMLTCNPEAPFTCVSAKDVAQAFYLASQREKISGQAYNIAAASAPPAKALFKKFIQKVGSRSPLYAVPLPLLKTSISLWVKTGLPLPFVKTPAELLPFALTGGAYDISKAGKELGWQPQLSPLACLILAYRWYIQHRQLAYAKRKRERL